MSEYSEVEKPFLQQLEKLGWTVIDQGIGIPQEAAPSLRSHFRQWVLPEVFDEAVRAINLTEDGSEWLTDLQLEDLRSQLLRQPNRTLLEANEAVQALLLKAQVDVTELMGNEVLVHFLLGEKSFVARFDPRTGVRIEDTIEIVVNMDNMHTFDPQTEKAIR